MINIYRKEIILNTSDGDIHIFFSGAQPRGYTALMDAVRSFEKMREEAIGLSKGDKSLAGAFVIDGEMRCLEEMKSAIQAALLPSEWEKISGIVDYIDISGMLEITSGILNAYIEFYNNRLKEGLEE